MSRGDDKPSVPWKRRLRRLRVRAQGPRRLGLPPGLRAGVRRLHLRGSRGRRTASSASRYAQRGPTSASSFAVPHRRDVPSPVRSPSFSAQPRRRARWSAEGRRRRPGGLQPVAADERVSRISRRQVPGRRFQPLAGRGSPRGALGPDRPRPASDRHVEHNLGEERERDRQEGHADRPAERLLRKPAGQTGAKPAAWKRTRDASREDRPVDVAEKRMVAKAAMPSAKPISSSSTAHFAVRPTPRRSAGMRRVPRITPTAPPSPDQGEHHSRRQPRLR